MDDGEGGLSFDFEGGLDSGPTNPTASIPVVQPNNNNMAAPAVADPAPGNFSGRRSFRQTVCRHWLRGLCMKADACGFLHQYDKARMPICRFYRLFGECREADCVYKHTDDDIKECNMYKLGFCPNGAGCRYRHIKQPGPPPPVEEVLQRFQQTYNYGNFHRFNQNRNGNYHQHPERPPSQDSGAANQGVADKSSTSQFPSMQPQQQVQPSLQQVGQGQLQSLANGQQNQENKTSTPLPEGISRYFIVKSCNRENLELSVQQGVWATQRSNEAKLNEAFDSVENVILIFSVNTTRHFQGCAKMTSKIAGAAASGGNWKYANGGAHFGRNFSVKWLKLCELSFHKTRHLRNPYNENLPVKISRDCQELEPFIGEQLASLLYLEPDSELMAISLAAEAKREEEKAKGTNLENGAENPDIVPFEDNDDEEEEEESDEEDDDDEESYEAYAAAQGRGRGRGPPMWPSQFPLARGARPLLGMRGFPPVMMGPDGFPYGGGMRPDGFPMPDPFGVGPRPFAPYGPRFPGDFAGPGPGMMFHGRPQPGGYGMGMGPGRAPFMGGGGPGRPGRPVGGMPPPSVFQAPPPSQQHSNHTGKRDGKGSHNDKMNRHSGGGSDSSKVKEIAGGGSGEDDEQGVRRSHPEDHSSGGAGNSLRNDESGSEDEAPRRSRHGEAKKKRRTDDQQM